MRNIYTETENYVAVKVPIVGTEGQDSMTDAVNRMMKVMEELRDKGLNPLHYLPVVSVWVCEKKQRVTRRREESRPTI